MVTDSANAQEELLDYLPFGSIRLDQKAGSFDEQRKYAGHEYDASTGLSYMKRESLPKTPQMAYNGSI